ncbi:MAG: SLC13 family permease [Myxococcota bacterium]
MPDTPIGMMDLGWQAWLTIAVVCAATLAMVRDRLGPDLVMFCALCVLVVTGVLSPEDALQGFSETAVVTIGVLFVCAAAMQETGALQIISRIVFGTTTDPTRALLRLIVPTAFMSAFMNNTPIVAMFIPMVRQFANRVGLPPSKMLIPLAWAAMFGGTCTLIGTSSNLVVSSQLQRSGLTSLGMLELGWVGVPTTLLGIAYLLTVGQRLLPARKDWLEAANEESREYLAEVEVVADSPLVGRTVQEAGLRNLPGLYLVEIRRAGGELVIPVAPEDVIAPVDHLVFTGEASTVTDLLAQIPGLKPTTGQSPIEDEGLFEVVISHRSTLVGRTAKEVGFRRRFEAAILAVHRAGERIEGRVGDIVFQPGDTLLISAAPGFRKAFARSAMFYLVSPLEAEPPPRYQKANVTLLTLLGLVLLPALLGVPMLVSAMGALFLLILLGCVTVRGARRSVNWTVLVLIGSAFGVASALDKSGAAAALGTTLVQITAPLGPRATLAAVYVAAVVFASFISNAAAAALLFPIATTAAISGGHDPRPFAIALAMAASAGFSTPIGCQPNLLVYGPGAYRYTDFTRVGLPLNLLLGGFAIAVIPLLWPL